MGILSRSWSFHIRTWTRNAKLTRFIIFISFKIWHRYASRNTTRNGTSIWISRYRQKVTSGSFPDDVLTRIDWAEPFHGSMNLRETWAAIKKIWRVKTWLVIIPANRFRGSRPSTVQHRIRACRKTVTKSPGFQPVTSDFLIKEVSVFKFLKLFERLMKMYTALLKPRGKPDRVSWESRPQNEGGKAACLASLKYQAE